jgi:5-methylcytosine-specific restriction enzyme subunit McrC
LRISEHVEDLLAAILAKGIANQTKRGLGREYAPRIDVLSSPHGKINIQDSLKKMYILKKRLVCEFDEFTENEYLNQILKSTALLLVRSNSVALEQKKALRKLLFYFSAPQIR